MMYFAFRLSFAFLMSGTLWTVNSEIHSLNYIYTALSKPVDLPGIHEFTAMGLLDDRMIDYYDSTKQAKIPKQPWMQEKLDADYWEKGTQSRKSKEQWFKVNVGILMERMRQNNSDIHVLQWRHGCEIERHPDGKETFVQGFDEYRYDGDDFLSFNDETMDWTAPNLYAVPTKRKWDGVEILNRYTKGYLEKECVEWLNKFETYSTDAVDKHVASKPPEVHVYAKKSPKTEGNLQLTCWATGFLPKEIELKIRKNEVAVTEGVHASEIRPNHDNTYQWWKRIEIPEGNKADYDCYVDHVALKEPIIMKWVLRRPPVTPPPFPQPVPEEAPLTEKKNSLDSGNSDTSLKSRETPPLFETEKPLLDSDKEDSAKGSSTGSQRSSDSQGSLA